MADWGVNGRLRVAGVQFYHAGGVFRPCFVSGFTLAADLVRATAKAIRFLDWAAVTGFNGVRVIVGALPWADQDHELAREGLEALLPAAAERGLYLEVTALTEPRPEHATHLRQVLALCTTADNALIELAHEPGRTARGPDDWSWLTRTGQSISPIGPPWAEGAPAVDTIDQLGSNLPSLRGTYATVHLHRQEDSWETVRRVRGLETFQYVLGRPILNNEPVAWGEGNEPGRRSADPTLAFALGVLSRAFDVGVVSHAQHGLWSDEPGLIQQRCHTQLVRGFHALPVDDTTRLQYLGSGTVGAPIRAWTHPGALRRAYTFLDRPTHGWVILLGRTGDPGLVWAHGFRPINVVDDIGAVVVLEVAA